MQLAERHIIKREHEYFAEIDALCFASKNLYNQANYRIRQEYIKNHKYLNYNVIQKQLQGEECYKNLPAKVSQQVLMLLNKNWKSFFAAIKAYNSGNTKFNGRPKLPKYKNIIAGRNLVIYTIQALSKPALKGGFIQPSKTSISIKTRVENPAQVRIVPKLDHYVVEVIYERTSLDLSDSKLIAALDLGVNNLAAVTFNQPGLEPLLINGRPLKSINQFYNQQKAELQSLLRDEKRTSRRIKRLATKRNQKIDNYLHSCSRWLIAQLARIGAGTLIIGKNEGWKQESNMGKRNNQNFIMRKAVPNMFSEGIEGVVVRPVK